MEKTMDRTDRVDYSSDYFYYRKGFYRVVSSFMFIV